MEPYPTYWRATAAGTAYGPGLSSGSGVRGLAGLSPTPNLDALAAELARKEAALSGVPGTRIPDQEALRRARNAHALDVARKSQQARRVDAEFAQRRDLERQRQRHAIQRGAGRHHSFVPQSMMPRLAKGALGGVRFPMRQPAFNLLKLALNLEQLTASPTLSTMFGPFMGYSLSNTCRPEFAVPPYLGNELMADLTSGAACLVLQAIAENPLPSLPASAPTVGFSTYRQGPFGRWATVATYDPIVAGDAPAVAAGPMMASSLDGSHIHNMVDSLSAAGGLASPMPLPLALNAALSGHNPWRAPGEQNQRGYGRVTQTQTQRGVPYGTRYGPANKKGRSRWHKNLVGFVGTPAFPRPYSNESKVLRVLRAIVTLVGQVTELLDHVDALYDALPEKIKKKCAAPFSAMKKSVSTKAKIRCLLAHHSEIDMGVAAYNLLYNAVFDRLQAQVSKAGVKLSAQYGPRPTMLSPSRAAPQDTETPHGSLSGAVKAFLRESQFKAPSTQDYLQALGWASAQRKAVVPRER